MKKKQQLQKKFLIAGIVVLGYLLLLSGIFIYSLTKASPLFSSLPTVTSTQNGHVGDPINIAFIGNKNKILTVFSSAQWRIPDPINETSTVKIIKASILNTAYPSAPVSNLYLFGRAQDLAFELPTNTVRKRHHVRLWDTSKMIAGQPLWIGSATFDSGIELSGTIHLPTHHISPNIDNERVFLVQSLEATELIENVQLQRITLPVLIGHNGGGDWYFGDGNAEVIAVK